MLFDVTVIQSITTDEGKSQPIEVKAMVNSEHLALVEPRSQGGSILSFPGGGKMVVKETKSEIKKALGLGKAVKTETKTKAKGKK